MRLDNLNGRRSLRLLFEEDTGLPLEPSRYPPILKHLPGDGVSDHDIGSKLKAMARDGVSPDEWRDAYKELAKHIQMNPISGLPGGYEYGSLVDKAAASSKAKKKFGEPEQYIVVAADVDNMQHLNDKSGLGHKGGNAVLKYIGQLFQEAFAIENTQIFHPSGDEFRVISYIGNDKKGREMPKEQIKARFVRLLQGCMEASNKLASTGVYQPGWEDSRRVQPTISFGISTTDEAANGVLTHVKTGASGGKPLKYAITIDRDLRYDLGFNPEELSYWLNTIKKGPGDISISSADSPEVMAYNGNATDMPATQRQRSGQPKPSGQALRPYTGRTLSAGKNVLGIAIIETKLPMETERERQGALVLEASWSEVPDNQKGVLKRVREQKGAYRGADSGQAMRVGDGPFAKWVPIKENYQR